MAIDAPFSTWLYNSGGFYYQVHNIVSFLFQRNAISTYNILNEEGRIVAAALLPYGAS